MFLLYPFLLASFYMFYRKNMVYKSNKGVWGPLNPIDDISSKIASHAMCCISHEEDAEINSNNFLSKIRNQEKVTEENGIYKIHSKRVKELEGYDQRYPSTKDDNYLDEVKEQLFHDFEKKALLEHLLNPRVSTLHKIHLIEEYKKTYNTDKNFDIFSGGLFDDWDFDPIN